MKVRLRKTKILASRGRFLILAFALAVSSVLVNISNPKTAHAAIGSVSEYTVPTANTDPQYLTVGPDNNIWFTGYGLVGKLTTAGSFTRYFSSGTYQMGITTGSDGNIWYSQRYYSSPYWYGRIVNMTTSGTVLAQYSMPGTRIAQQMTLGSDGNVWFVDDAQSIGKITTSGTITEYGPNYSCGQTSANVGGITAGPDGNIWFTVYCTGSIHSAIGMMTSSGTETYYSLPLVASQQPTGITTGPDGNLWFTDYAMSKIGKVTTSGTITEYSLSSAVGPNSITTGSDGALWFTEKAVGKIGRVTTAGVSTDYAVSDGGTNSLAQIVNGPDGAVWFANYFANKIGRVATQLTNQTVSFTSTAPSSAAIDGPTYTPTATATSGLSVAITVDSASSSVCSIDGSGKVSFQAAGTCTIDANQAGNADYNPAAQVQQSFTVAPVDADTTVALSCPATAHIGDTVSCTITATNNGPAAANNVTLTALVPSSLSGVSITGGGTLSGQTITWTTPSLASGGPTTITVSGTASTASKTQFNASVLQTSPDPDTSNNIANSTLVISN